jgi:two-component system chemotaxis response regulator CheB
MQKKVLVASVSAFRRTLLSEILSSHRKISVVEVTRNGQETIDSIENNHPDVLILDIEYNNKEWLLPFNLLIKQYKIPTIVLTDSDPKSIDSFKIPDVLNLHDFIIKPSGVWRDALLKVRDILISKVLKIDISDIQKIDSKVKLINKNRFIQQSQKIRFNPENQFKYNMESTFEHRSEEYFLDLSPITITKVPTKIIAIGASVGGPRTLRTILSEIPRDFPAPVLVVQHLNHLFMRQLVTSLRSICKITVKIGMNSEEIKSGIIYFSPGDKHMQVAVKNNRPIIRTFEGEPVHYCRPSVDVLFYSTARVYKEKTLGILLTGMGRDGVAGLKAIKSKGGKTIAESKETSVLYGMPKVAAETGAADLIVPNYQVVNEMIRFIS